MNKVILIGRLTKDPDLKFVAGSGTAVSRFTVAVNRQFKKDETDFINCVAFGKTAETISQYLTKGRQIAITGNIRTGSYDGQDGKKHYTTDICIESFEFIGSKQQNNSSESSPFDGGWESNGNDDITPVDDYNDMPF
ncbi:MAG: single-stranded DNA-binding protein [Clostridiaceae bacterium]|nr:single-stranded DNA-binding protein [Clostridiaceae bacterium]